jgi:glycosyltransferase involved in cell wall biosynthesis
MQIWHVIDSLEVGGAETMVATLCREQRRAGLLPSVHCLLRGGKLADDLRACHIPVTVHGPASLPAIGRRLFRLMRSAPPDAVHCHNETPAIVCAAAARMAGVPSIIATYHGMVVPLRAFRLKFWIAARFCDRLVAVSRTTQANLEQSPLSCPEKIVTLYNGAAPAANAAEEAPLCAPGEFPIVNVARHVPAKDHLTLLRGLGVARREDRSLVLFLVGLGPLTESLRRSAMELGIAEAVRFLGERADVGEILRQSKLFVLSSVNEGLPISLLEAMAAGLPHVVTQVGGMREVVEMSQAGLLVPPQDPEALAKAMLQFRADETWRLECAQRARQSYERCFTPEQMAAGYLKLYQGGHGR